MASKYYCDTCGKDIRLRVEKGVVINSGGFDCPGADHSYCSRDCYEQSDCKEFFEGK
ncbi:MAG: hypothetical protein INQ03_12855 [Candidatus Heimdallarchaeota archaeon]|nr:hypothetical protein [Candidatus Heimdallarchaeota archaeon]